MAAGRWRLHGAVPEFVHSFIPCTFTQGLLCSWALEPNARVTGSHTSRLGNSQKSGGTDTQEVTTQDGKQGARRCGVVKPEWPLVTLSPPKLTELWGVHDCPHLWSQRDRPKATTGWTDVAVSFGGPVEAHALDPGCSPLLHQ